MRVQPREIAITQLPEIANIKQGRIFRREFESSMNTDRPCIVLDCSRVHQIDRIVIQMLLCCLEEAIKRDGDVKLAAVPPSVRATLELTRIDRLFEIYDTEADAVSSYCQPHVASAWYAREPHAVD